MRKVAITGGLAAGKTTVCRIFKEHGAYVVSADEVVHQLLSPNTLVGQQIIELLGKEIIHNHQLDRAKIADKIFSDPQLLDAVEAIIHPAVIQEIVRRYGEVKQREEFSIFVAEIPLLYESESESIFDAVIAVVANPLLARQRFSSPEEYDRRMKRQLSQEEKAARADFVIVNNGSQSELKETVEKIIQQLSVA